MKMIDYGKYSNPTEYEEGQKKSSQNFKLVIKGTFLLLWLKITMTFLKSEKALEFSSLDFFLRKITFWGLSSYHLTVT